jgi:hypothetical protein
LRIEELEAMKFGKKRNNLQNIANILPSGKPAKKQIKRAPESYRRAEPKASEITDEVVFNIKKCPECGENLSDKKEHIHYREDLKTAQEQLENAKRIIKILVESGVCKNKNCDFFGKKITATEIPSQKVIIGENLRRMVVFQVIIQGQSYNEVQKNLEQIYNFKISTGQIINILEGESVLFTPYYNHLLQKLDEESKELGAHYDETSFKTQNQGTEISDGNYCWIKIGVETSNQIIWFGKSRGKKVAESLRGELKKSKGISDDYGSYHDLFETHQLCWAHPHRKFRDLAESGKLTGKTLKSCQKTYENFKELYKKARKYREKLLKEDLLDNKKQKIQQKLEKLFDELAVENSSDPEKLQTLKKTLRAKKSKYFTFFKNPQMPLDNNKAERAIRKIVIRRKKTLGCKSPKAANILSILYSVIFSLQGNFPDHNFFDLYDFAANFEE